MAEKENVRPIYYELQGCLAQAPQNEKHAYINDPVLWEHHNSTVTELNDITSKDYSKFHLTPKNGSYGDFFIAVEIYRQKLGGLITRLHGEYFKDKPAPFDTMPSTIINQTQSQSVQIEFILEVSNLINEKFHTAEPGSKQKSFFENIKGSLSKVKSVSQLIPLILKTAEQMNITIEELLKFFKDDSNLLKNL